jgi:hypothetical protein
VDEAVIDTRFFGELAGRDVRIADADEQPFGRVEQRLLRVFTRLRDADARALR